MIRKANGSRIAKLYPADIEILIGHVRNTNGAHIRSLIYGNRRTNWTVAYIKRT